MQPISPETSSSKQTRRKPERTKPARFHTAAEWDSIKPHLIHLYITEKKRLKEVQRILEDNYDFPATTKMLKSHITMWHVGKHRSEKEVRHALKIFRRAERAGRKVAMTIKGISTTLEDLLKHLRKKGIDEDSVQSPTSPTPTSIEYCEYEEDLEGGDEEEDLEVDDEEEEEQELDDEEESNNPSFAEHSTLLHDDLHGDVDYPSEFNVQHSTALMYDDRDEQFDPETKPEALVRRLTLSEDSMSGEPSDMGSEIPEETRDRISRLLRQFFDKTLPYTRPQSSYPTSTCPGREALKAYDQAIKRNDKYEAMQQYQKGLAIMELMMKAPNPFCIVYVCELMRIALMDNDAAMPEKMLDYVTDIATSPLTMIISSVMRANDDHGQSRIQLLGFVYENAMEIIERDSPENEVFEVLKNRFAILCSEM